jgi:hypothetical protein
LALLDIIRSIRLIEKLTRPGDLNKKAKVLKDFLSNFHELEGKLL